MARIDISPRVTNYLEQMDWRDAAADMPAFCAQLTDSYESGKLILLRNAPLEIDYDLLNQVSLSTGRRFKKITDKFFLLPRLYQPKVARELWSAFGIDARFFLTVRKEVTSVSTQVRQLGRTLFPHYRFLEWDVSWRFTPTGPEALHIDSFGSNENFQYVRIFINIDHEPRLWNASHRLEELAARHYDSDHLEELRGLSGNEFCRRLNVIAFGGMERAGADGQDRHVIEFEQGDVWLCDSRVVSHQIVRGRRLVASHFKIAPESMLDPARSIDARVQRLHERYASDGKTVAG